MEYYYWLLSEMPILSALQLAMMIWMLIDCIRRQAEYYWFWVILFLPGLGAWVYFFAVKIRDFRAPGQLRFWPLQRRVSLAELRFRLQQAATPANHISLAERLIEDRQYAEAVPLLEAVLVREPEYCPALYSLAVCHTRLEQPQQALPILEKIMAKDRAWRNYLAWYLLLEVRTTLGDEQGALAVGRDLVRQSPTIEHQCLLAQRLTAAGETDEAARLLDYALESYRFAQSQYRWRNFRWANQARRLQKRLQQNGRGK